MSELTTKYLAITSELLAARKQFGGTLPDEQEDEFLERFDGLWHQMTEEENQFCERAIEAMKQAT